MLPSHVSILAKLRRNVFKENVNSYNLMPICKLLLLFSNTKRLFQKNSPFEKIPWTNHLSRHIWTNSESRPGKLISFLPQKVYNFEYHVVA